MSKTTEEDCQLVDRRGFAIAPAPRPQRRDSEAPLQQTPQVMLDKIVGSPIRETFAAYAPVTKD
jgi:hypothetical protein